VRLAMLGCRGWIRTGDHLINSRMMEPVNGRLPTACRCALMGYMAPDFTTIRRFVAWFSIAVLGVASWLPAEEMIRTGIDGRLEHAAAYLISGLAIFTAYPRRLKWQIAILMTCYAGILEFGQLFVPGRHAAISDWAASSGGVLCALLLYDAYQRVYASAGDAEA
jgi:VanZ family protein